MRGRRSHLRFAVASPWDGAVRVLREAVIARTSRDELMAVCQAPGLAGEPMTLDLMGGGSTMRCNVVVVESRPVIISGAVRHRLRLALVPPVPDCGVVASPPDAAGMDLTAGLA
jgi:hypothetical protein